uniref:DUF1758 domain-containing protein n=1 Tax=Loa loa TaxID=7209 RepID=A0A1I7VR69_LOALO
MSQTNTVTKREGMKTLLLCKKITIFNPSIPHHRKTALALFDIGSQVSFISKKLASRSGLIETEKYEIKIAPFGTKKPKSCLVAQIQLGIQTKEEETIKICANVTDYLTKQFQVISVPTGTQLENLKSFWKQPDILAGVDYFFKFVEFNNIQELNSGFLLLQTKVGPMIVGSGDINKLCRANTKQLSRSVCVANVNSYSELETFWKLELMGINDQPNANDDEEALKQFKKSVIKCNGRYREQEQLGIIGQVDLDDKVGIIDYPPHHGRTHLLPDILEVLLRFRMMRNVILADIEKAFLQTEIHPEDRDCTRFLWLHNPKQGVAEENLKYRFKRVPFGVISSPFLLSATINFHLEGYDHELAAEIRKNIYADNIILSAKNTKDALFKYEQTKLIFERAAMNVREFVSNDLEFNGRIPDYDKANSNKSSFLGINWICDLDVIRITLKPWNEKEITKRTILQFVASQYDSLDKAYTAAVYVLNIKKCGKNSTFLIYAKSRIAPIKSITVPRLELLSALIGVRATQFVLKQLELKDVPVTLWSDSKCTLFWIKNHLKLLPRFVQNRVEEIRKTDSTFRYILSVHNPVDVATRGILPSKLKTYQP